MNKRKAIIIALVIIGIALAVLGAVLFLARMDGSAWTGDGVGRVFSRGTGYRFLDRGRYPGHMGFGFAWLPLAGFAILIALLAGFGRRHRHSNGHGQDGRHNDWERESAMDILRKEFAEGRIDKDAFLSRKQVLEESEK